MKKFRGIFIKNAAEVEKLRAANQVVADILNTIEAAVEPGRSTMFFEDIAVAKCAEHGVEPAFKGYHGYPFALCCSVNEEIVHGFPSKERILKEGDIVSCDMGVIKDGFFGDHARTFAVGEITPEARQLLDATREALMRGIAQAQPGNTLHDISRAIQEHAEGAGFGVVKRFVGHGIGRKLHEKPEVPNFVPVGASDVPLKEGMVLAIEPMVTLGSPEVTILDDKWTAVTKDGKLSAHFEHSIAVAPGGGDILSQY